MNIVNEKMRNCENVARKVEMADLFRIEQIDGKKRINRWGFFAKEMDGYAVYRPENPVVAIGQEIPDEDGPGAIDMLSECELYEFLASIGEIKPIAMINVTVNTACGWYYDTMTACCEDPYVISTMNI
jgi:hypothetical protein